MFYISIEAARVNAGLSQMEWADKNGVSRITAANWESGATPMPALALKMLSELSGIPMDYIRVPERAKKIGMEEGDA